MKRHAACNDEALLLLVHGELTLSARLQRLVHLASCPACRTRLHQYTQVSGGLAAGLGQPGQPPRLRYPRVPHAFPAPLWLLSGLVLVILGSVGSVLWQWRRANPLQVYSAGITLKECGGTCEEDCPSSDKSKPR